MRCPVCEKKSFFPYLEIFDDRYGEPNKYKLVKCKKCNFKATKKKTITPNIWTIMQIKSIFKRPIKGKPSKIWSVKINQNNIRTKKNINIRKTFSNFIKYTSHLILFLINRPIDTLGYGDSLIFFIKKKDR